MSRGVGKLKVQDNFTATYCQDTETTKSMASSNESITGSEFVCIRVFDEVLLLQV